MYWSKSHHSLRTRQGTGVYIHPIKKKSIMKLQAGHQVQYFPLSELKIKPNLAGRVPKSLNQQDTITLNSNGTFAHFAVLFFICFVFFTPHISHNYSPCRNLYMPDSCRWTVTSKGLGVGDCPCRKLDPADDHCSTFPRKLATQTQNNQSLRNIFKKFTEVLCQILPLVHTIYLPQ